MRLIRFVPSGRLYKALFWRSLSNVRGCGTSKVVISTYDALLAGQSLWYELKPDCVIQFGQIVVSKRVQQMIASWTDLEYIELTYHGLYESNR